MDKVNVVTVVSGAAGAVLSFLFGEMTPVFIWLVVFMVIDFVSGVVNACLDHTLSSAECAKGIARKVFILFLVAISHGVDTILGVSLVQAAVTFFYIASEGISILENCAKAGLPIPKKIIDILAQLHKDNGGEGKLK